MVGCAEPDVDKHVAFPHPTVSSHFFLNLEPQSSCITHRQALTRCSHLLWLR
jgi:hypothetical protein